MVIFHVGIWLKKDSLHWVTLYNWSISNQHQWETVIIRLRVFPPGFRFFGYPTTSLVGRGLRLCFSIKAIWTHIFFFRVNWVKMKTNIFQLSFTQLSKHSNVSKNPRIERLLFRFRPTDHHVLNFFQNFLLKMPKRLKRKKLREEPPKLRWLKQKRPNLRNFRRNKLQSKAFV